MEHFLLEQQQKLSHEEFYKLRVNELKSLQFSLLFKNPTVKQETAALNHQYIASGTDDLRYATIWRGENPLTHTKEIWGRDFAHVVKFNTAETLKSIRTSPKNTWIVDGDTQEKLDATA